PLPGYNPLSVRPLHDKLLQPSLGSPDTQQPRPVRTIAASYPSPQTSGCFCQTCLGLKTPVFAAVAPYPEPVFGITRPILTPTYCARQASFNIHGVGEPRGTSAGGSSAPS